MRSITLTAKEKICMFGKCNPLICPNAHGHFDRVNGAILDLVENNTVITREVVQKYADKHLVCPFELGLDASLFCDCIICDYNHVYDPKSKLKRYFTEGGDFIVLTDEAHNLTDRARDMFSADLTKVEFDLVSKMFPGEQQLKKLGKRIAKEILAVAKEGRPSDNPVSYTMKVSLEKLFQRLIDFAAEAHEILENGNPSDELLQLYFRAMDFLRVSELYDARYTTFVEMQQEGKPSIKLLCLDPSLLLAKAESASLASVFFSATLTPLPYFRQILGGDEKDYILQLRSPFSPKNLCLMADKSISTKYVDREKSYEPIAKDLSVMAKSKAGNYIAFFPSYDYLNKVLAIFTEKYPNIPTLAQSSGMDDKNREAFLESFKPGGKQTLLGFAVLGGVFSEGIDLKSDRLIGAAIIGVALPLICPERDAISKYYQESGKRGFDYAYVYPGMNKVLQAAGRVIRSETDRGAVLLIDSRYGRSDYKDLFPPEWAHCIYLNGYSTQEKMLKNFWDEKEKELLDGKM
jgi:Rad3-related DNA helicase